MFHPSNHFNQEDNHSTVKPRYVATLLDLDSHINNENPRYYKSR